ncbi:MULTISPECIES: hypothetical protein [unclassified Thiomonas]|uniref:hypothetical protein n=1 Tax=unclassified Thiomonas TaxID=2625466 RepID=UPI0004DBC8F0|nr:MULTISPECIES: hypothetical protein [unclassified Thiomonas]CDW96497.1 mobE [Thiomonas sp. CB2]SCC95921.1 conserved membrane protein of unknown function [Thiomonas sp. X19]VDY15408.1 conserved membrane protein of unknown function [Thiomonas sp. OC7]VDY19326.1 mobE [Thiomonas sp. CB2]
MSDLRASIQLITGAEPTPQTLQRVQAIAHALGIPANDAMFPILVMLDSYHGAFSKLPADVAASNKQAAEQSARQAAAQAQAEVNKAVAALVPTVEQAVGRAAAGAVRRIQFGRSMFSLVAAMLVLAVAFGLGWVAGAQILYTAEAGKLAWSMFLTQSGSGIGLGVAAGSLLLYALTGAGEGEGTGWHAAAGLAGLSLVGLLGWRIFAH